MNNIILLNPHFPVLLSVHIIIYKLSQEVIMERRSKIAESFDLNREKITLVAGGIGVVFS